MQEFQGTITEDMEGEILTKVICDHWHAGCGAMVLADEVFAACKATHISADRVLEFTHTVDEYRGHDHSADVLTCAFVPEENMGRVCELLDEIIGLCVKL